MISLELLASTDLDGVERKIVEGLLVVEEKKLLQIGSERAARKSSSSGIPPDW